MGALTPEAVVFDNDGLLLDTELAWTRAETELFARHDSAFTLEHKRDLIGSSRATAAAKLERMLGRPGAGEALMDEIHELVMAELLAGVEPMPGALELVEALEAAGRPIAVATNSSPAFVARALGVAGLTGRFAAVISAHEVAAPKPAPDVYLAACAAIGAAPARSVGLEDSATGVAAVRAAGMLAVGVPSLAGVDLGEADVVAASLRDPVVHRAVGL
jgi:HAD superfamily hydrolase (TIGR01509 family)